MQPENLKQTEAGERVRVAVVGLGHMCQLVHLPSLAANPNVDLVAFCDLNETLLASVAKQYGVSATFLDYRKMTEAVSPDAVYVISHPHLVYDVWKWFLEQRIPLFIEKPMGLTIHQASALATLAEEAGVPTQVDHQRRSSPAVLHLRELASIHGAPTHAVCEFYKYSPRRYLEARDHMMDDFVHVIDTLRSFDSSPVIQVNSVCRRLNTPDINWIEVLLQHASGFTSTGIANWVSGRRMFRVQLHAPGFWGQADLEGDVTIWENGEVEPTVTTAQELAGSDDFYVFGGFRRKTEEFIDAVRNRTLATSSSFGDVYKTMRIACHILASTLLSEGPEGESRIEPLGVGGTN